MDWKIYDLARTYTVIYIADDHRGYFVVGVAVSNLSTYWIFWFFYTAYREYIRFMEAALQNQNRPFKGRFDVAL